MTRTYYTEVEIECDHGCVGFPPHECLHHTIWYPEQGDPNMSPEHWNLDVEGSQPWIDEGEPADICDPCWSIMDENTPHKEGE